MLKDSIKKHVEGSFLYPPLRDIYQMTLNRSHWEYRKRLRRFYAQFFAPGQLVFDVGANVGFYTDVFLKLGARVVAIEPNVSCLPALQGKRPRHRVAVEAVAIGSAVSTAQFYLCDDATTHSTLSPDWIRAAHAIPRLVGKEWSRAVQVPVTTLDMLITKYGEPEFMKIDVEAFEREALSGLSRSPKYLSFEFVSEFADAAIECVKKDCFCGSTYFNFIFDEAARPSGSIEFELEEWVPAEQMVEVLSSARIRDAKTYGEIFVRRCA